MESFFFFGRGGVSQLCKRSVAMPQQLVQQQNIQQRIGIWQQCQAGRDTRLQRQSLALLHFGIVTEAGQITRGSAYQIDGIRLEVRYEKIGTWTDKKKNRMRMRMSQRVKWRKCCS